MRFLYTLSIHLYHIAILIASLFLPKAKLWINGRKGLLASLKNQLDTIRKEFPRSQIVWFHCASLGEFEQGRSLIERYRKEHPEDKILLTFFSPSGYEVRKKYAGADLICYLPLDTPSNANGFIDLLKPKAVFFVKYEFWFNYLNALKERDVPVYLVSGIFRDDHYFFKTWGGWARKQLKCFTHFFLQDEHSLELLNGIGFTNTTLSGDTRFDRVYELSQNAVDIPLVAKFCNGGKILIAGSTWPEDEKMLHMVSKDFKMIIAPHELSEKHLESIESEFKEWKCLRFSGANENSLAEANVLIIDNIGMLSSLYRYGTIAFIGGGFGSGIHNILEAATYGLPVIFGPNYQKFIEAKELIRLGGAFSIRNTAELKDALHLLSDEMVLKTASHVSKNYVKSHTGATDCILKTIRLS